MLALAYPLHVSALGQWCWTALVYYGLFRAALFFWRMFCYAAHCRLCDQLWREAGQLLTLYATAADRCNWAVTENPRAYPIVRQEFDRIGDEYRGLKDYLTELKKPSRAARLAYATDKELARELRRRRAWPRRWLERRLP